MDYLAHTFCDHDTEVTEFLSSSKSHNFDTYSKQ